MRTTDEILAGCVKEKRFVLTEEEGRIVLQSFGIPVVPGGVAACELETVEIAREVGYPVVMKVLSPDIPHKSDVGGVKLGLSSDEQVRGAWQEIMISVANNAPEARILGMSIQKQAQEGIQVIVGGMRDAHFGPVVMFGLGGIYTEIFEDIAFRMAPISRIDAKEMVESTLASKILAGFRGERPVDVDLLYQTLISLGTALLQEERIREIEINPFVLWPGGGGVALDALVTVEN